MCLWGAETSSITDIKSYGKHRNMDSNKDWRMSAQAVKACGILIHLDNAQMHKDSAVSDGSGLDTLSTCELPNMFH